MKKLLVLGIMLLSLRGVGAERLSNESEVEINQADSSGGEHLSFKGIPIDGSLDEFMFKMRYIEYRPSGRYGNAQHFDGIFIGEPVTIVAEEAAGNVYRVEVQFRTWNSWKELSGQYEQIKSLLTAKYGSPVKQVEQCQSGYGPGSNLELMGIHTERCLYQVDFESGSPAGSIQLSISKKAAIRIVYLDKINYDKTINQFIDDL